MLGKVFFSGNFPAAAASFWRGLNPPSVALLFNQITCSVHHSAHGYAAFVSYGYARHMENFPQLDAWFKGFVPNFCPEFLPDYLAMYSVKEHAPCGFKPESEHPTFNIQHPTSAKIGEICGSKSWFGIRIQFVIIRDNSRKSLFRFRCGVFKFQVSSLKSQYRTRNCLSRSAGL